MAFLSAREAGGGLKGYAIAAIVGLLVGLICLGAARITVVSAAKALGRYSERIQERCLRALYFSAILWMILATMLSRWLTLETLRRQVEGRLLP